MKLILAPMRGYTDKIFREVWSKHFSGIDEAVTPFIPLGKADGVSDKLLKDFLEPENVPFSVTPQALSNNAEAFLVLAKRLADLGFRELNWNMGCPFRMVARKTKGSGLLCKPDFVDAFFDKIFSDSPLEISVKIRLGREKAEEMHGLLPILNRYPLSRIFVHPRVGVQMYEGRPDLDAFSLFLEKCEKPVSYNGDIWTLADYSAISARFPEISSWMLGRGLLCDPFLAERLRGNPISKDEKNRFISFYEDLENAYAKSLSGASHLLARLKGWWACFHLFFEDGEGVFKKLRKMDRLDAFRKEAAVFFEGAEIRKPSQESWIGQGSLKKEE